jgi:hypothetical protein
MNPVKCLQRRRAAKALCPLIFLWGGFFLSPARAAPPAAAPGRVDFPLALTTRWTYHLHQKMGPGVHFGEELAKLATGDSLDVAVITEVVGSDVINGEKYVRLESRLNGAHYMTEWHRQTASGLLLGKTFSAEEGQELLMVPPQKLLSSTLKAGESWDWKPPDSPAAMHIRVVGPADVTVPAGAFHTTQLSHVLTLKTEGGTVTARQTRWFAPGVGYVKQDTETRLGDRLLAHIVLTLEKYEPARGVQPPAGR